MSNILFGLETELAFSAESRAGGGAVPGRVDLLAQLLDEVAGRVPSLPDADVQGGLFLGTGARAYLDAGAHEELCSPECLRPEEVVRYDLAAMRTFAEALVDLEKRYEGEGWALFRCNVDYSGSGAVWGCHESYSVERPLPSFPPHLVPHLVSRIVITGAGGFDNRDPARPFLLSPRVPHFHGAAAWSPTAARALIHDRRESLSSSRWDRLHLMAGESLCSQIAGYLKVGATALVVKLIDQQRLRADDLSFDDPLHAMRVFANDPSCRAEAPLSSGRSISAVAMQRELLERVRGPVESGDVPDWAPTVCDRWATMLDRLEGGAEAVSTTLDWAIKHAIFAGRSRARRRSARSTAELAEIDTRFGELGPRGLFAQLDAAGALDHGLPDLGSIDEATRVPPPGARAEVRGRAVIALSGQPEVVCRWDCVLDRRGKRMLRLEDPFATDAQWVARDEEALLRARLTSTTRRAGRPDAYVLLSRGRDAYMSLDLATAERNLGRATRALEALQDGNEAAEARFWLACTLQDLGRAQRGLEVLRPAIGRVQGGGSAGMRARLLTRYGLLLVESPAPLSRIEAHLGEVDRICAAASPEVGRSRRTLVRGRLLAAQGRLREGLATLERALDEYERDPVSICITTHQRWLVRLYVRAGDLAKAEAIAAAWDAFVRREEAEDRPAYMSTEYAMLLCAQGEPERAMAVLAPVVGSPGGALVHRYRVAALAAYVEAAALCGAVEAARPAFAELAAVRRLGLGELRFDMRRALLAFLSVDDAPADALLGSAHGADAVQLPLIDSTSSRRAAARHALRREARLLDRCFETDAWVSAAEAAIGAASATP